MRVNEKGELVIHSESEVLLSNGESSRTRTLIKRYILPKNADVAKMSSKLGEDGRLVVNVPLTHSAFNTM